MTSLSASRLRSRMITAAHEGGNVALRYFGKRVRMQEKSARDFVTEADERSEQVILRCLRREYPSASIHSEEAGIDQRGGSLRFVVDPLDATTNFMLGSPEWSVMIAAFRESRLLASVIYLPVSGETYTAEAGRGAWVNAKRIRVATVSELRDAVVSLNRSSFPPPIIDPSVTVFRRITALCKSFRDLGTAGVEYARIARGQLHGIVTPLAESVHVAGYLLMREAGAVVTDAAGQEAGIESKTIVAAGPVLHSRLLALLRDIEFKPVGFHQSI